MSADAVQPKALQLGSVPVPAPSFGPSLDHKEPKHKYFYIGSLHDVRTRQEQAADKLRCKERLNTQIM
jgi:hypothetical protein